MNVDFYSYGELSSEVERAWWEYIHCCTISEYDEAQYWLNRFYALIDEAELLLKTDTGASA